MSTMRSIRIPEPPPRFPSDLVQAVIRNAQVRYKAAVARGRRKAAQARAIEDEPEGHRHVADPWNTMFKFDDMSLHLCDSAKETLRELKNRFPQKQF